MKMAKIAMNKDKADIRERASKKKFFCSFVDAIYDNVEDFIFGRTPQEVVCIHNEDKKRVIKGMFGSMRVEDKKRGFSFRVYRDLENLEYNSLLFLCDGCGNLYFGFYSKKGLVLLNTYLYDYIYLMYEGVFNYKAIFNCVEDLIYEEEKRFLEIRSKKLLLEDYPVRYQIKDFKLDIDASDGKMEYYSKEEDALFFTYKESNDEVYLSGATFDRKIKDFFDTVHCGKNFG